MSPKEQKLVKLAQRAETALLLNGMLYGCLRSDGGMMPPYERRCIEAQSASEEAFRISRLDDSLLSRK